MDTPWTDALPGWLDEAHGREVEFFDLDGRHRVGVLEIDDCDHDGTTGPLWLVREGTNRLTPFSPERWRYLKPQAADDARFEPDAARDKKSGAPGAPPTPFPELRGEGLGPTSRHPLVGEEMTGRELTVQAQSASTVSD